MPQLQQPAQLDPDAPVFDADDPSLTVDLYPDGHLGIDLGDGHQWCVTLCARTRHDPSVALWGVAEWGSLASPIGCFLAPTESSARTLRHWAAVVVTGVAEAGRGDQHADRPTSTN